MARLNAAINVDCPSCGKSLPTVPIKSQLGRFAIGVPTGWFVRLEVDLSDDWWEQVNHDHITCVLT